MNIIIFDFEVFKYDTLLGVIELHNNEEKLIQMWNLDDIKNYFYSWHAPTISHSDFWMFKSIFHIFQYISVLGNAYLLVSNEAFLQQARVNLYYHTSH